MRNPTEKSFLIDDELNQIEFALERARCVLQDVVEDYFGIDPKGENATLKMQFGFERYNTKTLIVQDYLARAGEALTKIQEAMIL